MDYFIAGNFDEDAAWEAVSRRDRTADGRFFTAVKTTGIYCRPSCAGRPLRKNVSFVLSCEAAEAAGYRACKRCKPELLRGTALS